MLRLFVNILCCLTLVQTIQAQEVHFSAIRQIPYFFNPAYTGFIEKDVRAGLIYRNQSPTFSKAFNTLGYGVDFSVLKQKTNNNSIIGVGVNGYYDRAGALNFTDNSFTANFSYIQALDKRQRFYLSFGIMAGYAFRKIDLTKATFEDGFNGEDGFVPVAGSDINPVLARNRHIKLGAGFIAFFNLSKNINFHVGAAGYDLAAQNLSFNENSTVKQKPRIIANFGMEVKIKKVSILPYFLMQMKKPQKEIVFGSMVKYSSDNNQYNFSENSFSIGGGVGYRYLDALILSAQAGYKNFTINLSYDVNISKLSKATRTVGAAEVSIIYQNSFISTKKKGKALACPKMSF
jgi:type IX secretion system PorP/SprF family membrane protein